MKRISFLAFLVAGITGWALADTTAPPVGINTNPSTANLGNPYGTPTGSPGTPGIPLGLQNQGIPQLPSVIGATPAYPGSFGLSNPGYPGTLGNPVPTVVGPTGSAGGFSGTSGSAGGNPYPANPSIPGSEGF